MGVRGDVVCGELGKGRERGGAARVWLEEKAGIGVGAVQQVAVVGAVASQYDFQAQLARCDGAACTLTFPSLLSQLYLLPTPSFPLTPSFTPPNNYPNHPEQAAESLEALETYPAEPEVHKYLLDRWGVISTVISTVMFDRGVLRLNAEWLFGMTHTYTTASRCRPIKKAFSDHHSRCVTLCYAVSCHAVCRVVLCYVS